MDRLYPTQKLLHGLHGLGSKENSVGQPFNLGFWILQNSFLYNQKYEFQYLIFRYIENRNIVTGY
jgi:hypothetical protein